MIDVNDLVVGNYYAGYSGKGNIAQWDGEDFVLSIAPEYAAQYSEDWEHIFLLHPHRSADGYYGDVFIPYEDLTVKVDKEYNGG